MRKLILSTVLLLVPIFIKGNLEELKFIISHEESTSSTKELTFEELYMPLVNALIQVESQGNPNALGTSDDRGILQITPICVAEVNRLSKNQQYTHDDAWNVEKSIEMFFILAQHYCPEVNYEKMARIWNGGPKGYTKSYTIGYWEKVQKELDILS